MSMKFVNGQYGDWNDQESRWNTPPTSDPGRTTSSPGGVVGPNPPQAPPTQDGTPQGTFDRAKFMQEWYAQGGDPGGFVGGHQQDFAAGVKAVPGSKDKFILPTGEVMDLSIDFGPGGANKPAWTGAGHWTGTQVVPYGSPGAPGAAGASSAIPALQPPIAAAGKTEAGSVSQSVAPVRDPRLDELYNTLLTRSKQGLAMDRNDPVIRAQADAYSANEERARRNYLGDIAERSGPLANLRGEQRMASERVGQRTGAFEAELMGRELQTRRGEIMQSLNSMQGLLTTEQQLALQKELANMDDALRRLQLQQQGSQFGQELGFRYAGLGSQEDMFAQQLGLQAAQQSNYFDWLRSGGGQG